MGKQRNMSKMKAQKKSPGKKKTTKMEAGKLPDIEFKTFIRILRELNESPGWCGSVD